MFHFRILQLAKKISPPPTCLKAFLQALLLNEDELSFMLDLSGPHSILWVCIFSASGECEQTKSADLLESGTNKAINS